MKVLIRQFLGQLHSWSIVGHGIARGLIQQGHEVHLFSTDGTKHLPLDLKPYLIGHWDLNKQYTTFGRLPDAEYDAQISYTAMKNFPIYLSNGNKNRFGIWCFEWNGKNSLPSGFAKHYKECDYLCAPSNFAKEVFMNSGIPGEAIRVIPHGINADDYRKASIIDLGTNKKFKIGVPLAQTHKRKNIPGILEAYGRAFTSKDDVSLILKAKDKPITNLFDISLNSELSKFKKKFPNHAEVKVYSNFIDDMSDFYRSIDCLLSLSNTEGFYVPALEAIAAGKVVIAPRHGGQLDFLNDQNALLVSGKEVRADPSSMYWEQKVNASWFQPDINDAVDKLRAAYVGFEKMNEIAELKKESVLQKFDWKNVSKQFMDLVDV